MSAVPRSAAVRALDLASLVNTSIDRLREDLKHLPVASEVFWRRATLRSPDPADMFLNPLSTPVLLFPLWLEQSITDTPDVDFQYELAYASINLLYYVRFLDDAMDGDVASAQLLPLVNSLQARFHGAFQKLFPPEDQFWGYFFNIIDYSAEITITDFSLDAFTASQFMDFAAQKSCCAWIPIAAVACWYKQYDSIEPWTRLWTAFSTWNQMRDDISDWFTDLKNGTATYLLSEAKRLKQHDENIPQWMLREGYEWSLRRLNEYAKQARELAVQFNVPDMRQDLDSRYTQVSEDLQLLIRTLDRIDHIKLKPAMRNGKQQGNALRDS